MAFLAADGVERSELAMPWAHLHAAGAEVELVSLEGGTISSVVGDQAAAGFDVDREVSQADASDYDALVLPGGVANPDHLRTDEDAVAFVRAFAQSGKPIGAICHGPWMLVEADVIDGLTLTSFPSLRTDIENAGATWVDEQVHTDQGIITSRKPDDLDAFCDKLVEEIGEGVHSLRAIRSHA